MSLAEDPRLKTVLNSPANVKNAMEPVRAETGCTFTVLHPTEVRDSLTSPRLHPHWIFDKNAPFFQAIVSISSGFFQ